MADDVYDGCAAGELRSVLDLPRVEVFESVTSTLDVAHTLGASHAPAGTLVLAEHQSAGRGRGGRKWASPHGAGIWLTLLERPNDPTALELLSIRVGICAARVLERWTAQPIRLKWPNDLYGGGRKLGGILIEARWRDQRLDWVALGLGINVRTPEGGLDAAALEGATSRVEVLTELVPALRAAAAARGELSEAELQEYADRDLALGRRCVEPVPGVVRGIDARGSLVVNGPTGDVTFRAGSLVLEEGW